MNRKSLINKAAEKTEESNPYMMLIFLLTDQIFMHNENIIASKKPDSDVYLR